MARKLTIELPDEAYDFLCNKADEFGSTREEIAGEWLAGTIHRLSKDPLLQLEGFESEVTDGGERHDDYIGLALMKEMQDVNSG